MNNKVKKNSSEIGEEFFYGYKSAQKGDSSVNRNFLGVFINSKKIFILGIILLGGGLILFSKAFYLQVVKGSYYYELAEGNRAKLTYITSNRGLIYDEKKEPLVYNEPIFDISIVPSNLPYILSERADRVNAIAAFVNIDPIILTELITSFPPYFNQPVTIKENISYEDAIKYTVELDSYSSLSLDIRNKRNYIEPDIFSHLLGYVGKINNEELNANSDKGYLLNDYIGKTGLELQYEGILRGTYGFREQEVDATGRLQKVIYEKSSENGESIVLNIDSVLQKEVYRLTEQHLKAIGKKKASVIVMDPSTGNILSMVSYPEYDDNLFARGISQDEYNRYIDDKDNPLFNRSIKGEYPSGSTIKLIVGAAALEENIISDNTNFLSTGGITVADKWFFPDWKVGGHGYTNIYRAISESINTFFYIIGGGYEDIKGLGLDKLVEYYNLFGLGKPTGIDLPGEGDGLVPTREWKLATKDEEWYIGDTYHMAIGQGDVLVTPLQVANYTAFFANGGKLYKPHLVKSIIDEDGLEQAIEPEVLNDDFIDQYNISVISKGMRRAVTDGSARQLSALPFSSAGKTGTAQFSKKKAPHAWFTGFAPYEDPKIVVTVLIEEGGEGSQTAVPLASKIMYYYFTEYLNNLDAE